MIEHRLTIRRIATIFAADYVCDLAVMRGASRRAANVFPRQVAMYLVHHHLGKSLPEIGRFFGNRDHTTVLHAVRVVSERAKWDEGLAGRLRALGKRIDAAEAEVAAAPPVEVRALPETEPATAPVTVVVAPPPGSDEPAARQVLDAVRGYVESRKALRDAEHTRGEFGARRRAEAEYALLDRAWSAYAAGRDRS
ncbi:helix-turn-helix domain-containing protein [uncultured Methylobacterium sp.]|uniref:helix-turn-helix domain-containing protein n=1 Tax=uncultured Methylobacterium sp. TaxID=157278 RepID=UPI0025870B3C|nr:helix-turn-helix domain-containing protein [uncultured Methylobacterium sp.]